MILTDTKDPQTPIYRAAGRVIITRTFLGHTSGYFPIMHIMKSSFCAAHVVPYYYIIFNYNNLLAVLILVAAKNSSFF